MVSIELITGDETLQMALMGLCGLVMCGVVAYFVYIIVRFFNKLNDTIVAREECKIDMAKNEMYLNDVYTSYKAGLVIKTAEDEKVTLVPRPAEPEMNIAQTLKEQVKAEIQN